MDIYLVWCVHIENGQGKLEQISQLFSSSRCSKENEWDEVGDDKPFFPDLLLLTTLFLVYALIRATVAVLNDHDQRQLEEEFIWFTYPGLITVTMREANQVGTWKQELIQSPLEQCCLLACVLFYRTQDYQPPEVPVYHGFGPPPLIIN